MKRLIKNQYGNIFQICRAFRNSEQLGHQHNPEFTMLEWYTVDADYIDSLILTKELLAFIEDLSLVSGLHTFTAEGVSEISVRDAFIRFAGIDLDLNQDLAVFKKTALSIGESAAFDETWEEVYNRIFVSRIEPELAKLPTVFVTDFPKQVHCLAKVKEGSPYRERWELYLNGFETANCFTEETDPSEVARFLNRNKA